MALSSQDLEKVIELAHLEIPKDQHATYLAQLQKVFTYLDSFNKVDLSGIEASSHAFEQETAFRADEVVPQPDLFLERNAPLWENDCFQVPKILDKE